MKVKIVFIFIGLISFSPLTSILKGNALERLGTVFILKWGSDDGARHFRREGIVKRQGTELAPASFRPNHPNAFVFAEKKTLREKTGCQRSVTGHCNKRIESSLGWRRNVNEIKRKTVIVVPVSLYAKSIIFLLLAGYQLQRPAVEDRCFYLRGTIKHSRLKIELKQS